MGSHVFDYLGGIGAEFDCKVEQVYGPSVWVPDEKPQVLVTGLPRGNERGQKTLFPQM